MKLRRHTLAALLAALSMFGVAACDGGTATDGDIEDPALDPTADPLAPTTPAP